jgi:hypothetical protein
MILWHERVLMVSYFSSAFPLRGEVSSMGSMAGISLSRHLPSPWSSGYRKPCMVQGQCQEGLSNEWGSEDPHSISISSGYSAWLLSPSLSSSSSQGWALPPPAPPFHIYPEPSSFLGTHKNTSRPSVHSSEVSHLVLLEIGKWSSHRWHPSSTYHLSYPLQNKESFRSLVHTEGPAKPFVFWILSLEIIEGKKSLLPRKRILVNSKKLLRGKGRGNGRKEWKRLTLNCFVHLGCLGKLGWQTAYYKVPELLSKSSSSGHPGSLNSFNAWEENYFIGGLWGWPIPYLLSSFVTADSW